MEAIIQPQLCPTHPDKLMNIVCLDSSCKKSSLICLICLKNNHSNCNDDTVMGFEEFSNRMKIKESDSGTELWKNRIEEVLNANQEKLLNSLYTKKESILFGFNKLNSSDNLLSHESLLDIKKNFKITLDDDSNDITISSKLDASNDKLEEGIEIFQKELSKKTDKYIQEFNNLNFYIRGEFHAGDWLGHSDIKVTDMGSHLELRRDTNMIENYFITFYNNPLQGHCKYKLTVKSVPDYDRYIDFGIMSQSNKESKNNNFVSSYGWGSISYCGYAAFGGVSGKQLAYGLGDANGYKEGAECIMEYSPGDYIKFYNEEGTLDLKKSMKGDETTYYMFIILYFPTSWCTLEALS